ncbi:hypothetical protein LEP1GSC103_3277 [Leptospira borgpetersenii serovar Javanica str. UI 09931]|uniref:Uncharacterized protein n=4 Tax=Leptospira borgpetersenii TaxID=174 RepID=M3HIE9_LEPBO|nr:hypothetical protein LEP1GSC128_2808 [Leptospira borgpetersenii str. 200801926]EKQ90743.1 hypothetical protein LEP1GSC101_0715 [Leptospira borgpetersenii str. UI 09149]EMF97885.1 hypothetical protein LEP1GSC123_4101 [Leptospira borgpetersenii str. 200701203]EMK14815.1 hypothetical protein LEP1GSC066_0949 [Leptospira sp. serovar Kenya str. Sh9]EMN13254.1 hypothetical protein LEP1GSC055_0839 [Leptospira borgpetersenii str. Brem 307]EMN19019.1 hypothetical protein LEP1GSC056_1934 [Leptospira b
MSEHLKNVFFDSYYFNSICECSVDRFLDTIPLFGFKEKFLLSFSKPIKNIKKIECSLF